MQNIRPSCNSLYFLHRHKQIRKKIGWLAGVFRRSMLHALTAKRNISDSCKRSPSRTLCRCSIIVFSTSFHEKDPTFYWEWNQPVLVVIAPNQVHPKDIDPVEFFFASFSSSRLHFVWQLRSRIPSPPCFFGMHMPTSRLLAVVSLRLCLLLFTNSVFYIYQNVLWLSLGDIYLVNVWFMIVGFETRGTSKREFRICLLVLPPSAGQ